MALFAGIKSKTFISTTPVEIDATNVVDVSAKGVVDMQKGTFQITARLTTKAISGDPESRAIVFKQLTEEFEKVSIACLEEITSIGENPNQLKLDV